MQNGMSTVPSRFMQFLLHPIQSMATILRSWSTGLPAEKLAEYDRDFIQMIKEGNVKLYGSADVIWYLLRKPGASDGS